MREYSLALFHIARFNMLSDVTKPNFNLRDLEVNCKIANTK